MYFLSSHLSRQTDPFPHPLLKKYSGIIIGISGKHGYICGCFYLGEVYFQGKKELFKGQATDRLEKEWDTCPVLHIVVVKLQDVIYIFEFKMDRSAGDALAQINSKRYAIPYEGSKNRGEL